MQQPQHHTHDCARIHALAALIDGDAIDAALEAGLMEVRVDASCSDCATAAQRVAAAQARLRFNWAARERYRARTARLQRRAAERQARRAPAPILTETETKTVTAPSLPPAVAAALARAKARAAARPGS
ncbi:hypothetical protein [Pseudoxanthomonas sp.]|uniref:hypothetical protein n=1 Tax=Pseudoxanthomonas sp. TaxID=1871049 RepID=UPI0026363BF1|nr:hypothetical protein [Pseudoxanthomonas sp.]WDS37291.1 MAG: hypothetical protein O8I58_05245 [Pseudoxanthomonas sp.]